MSEMTGDAIASPATITTEVTPAFICEVCDQPCASAAGLAAHKRSHDVKGKPAIIPEWRRTNRLRIGQREITMLDPRCSICRDEENAPSDWYTRCPHDPYVSVVPVKENRPVLEDEVIDGRPTGRKKVAGMEEFVSYVIRPNTRGITLSMGTTAGLGVVNARRKGFILPSELRSPSFPNGIADSCQFRDCKYQLDLKDYSIGQSRATFCREIEAQLVWYAETGTTLEIGEWNEEARANRTRMLQEAQIR